MSGVSVAGCRIYGAVCDAVCAIAASEMVWVERNGLILRTLGTNFENGGKGLSPGILWQVETVGSWQCDVMRNSVK